MIQQGCRLSYAFKVIQAQVFQSKFFFSSLLFLSLSTIAILDQQFNLRSLDSLGFNLQSMAQETPNSPPSTERINAKATSWRIFFNQACASSGFAVNVIGILLQSLPYHLQCPRQYREHLLKMRSPYYKIDVGKSPGFEQIFSLDAFCSYCVCCT